MILVAVALMVFGPLAAATIWSSGSYGFETGSVMWQAKNGNTVEGVTQLGGSAGQASVQEQTSEIVQLGGTFSQASSQGQTAAVVQLGSSGGQASSQATATGGLQLSGYFENMGSYTNIYYPSTMLSGSFGSAGSGGCCGQ